MTTLVVPLDRSARSEAALPVARAIAERGAFDLSLVTAADGLPSDEDVAYITSAAAGLAVLRTTSGAVPADPSAAAAIERFASWAAEPIICMATHGRGALVTAVIGSTADEVLRITTHPVLLIGPNCVASELFGASRLVVPLDGSAASEMIVPVAIDIAHKLGLAPWLLQIDVPFDEQMAGEMTTVFERVSNRFRTAALEPHTKLMVATDPTRSIAHYAKTIDASMIAMTTHSGTGVRRLVLGSVAMATVRAARCPVLVMRPDAPERDRSAFA